MSVKVLSVSIDEENIVTYIQNTLGNAELAYKMSARCNLPGADQLFLARFAQLFQSGNYSEAAKIAATAPRVNRFNFQQKKNKNFLFREYFVLNKQYNNFKLFHLNQINHHHYFNILVFY